MMQTDVFLGLAPRAPLPQSDRLRLAAAVARACAVDLATITIEQRCERCGGPHGRPRVLTPPGTFVSLSRAGPIAVVAVSLVGPIGVDIETVSAVSRAGFDDVAFNDAERATLASLPAANRDHARAIHWTAKEALLKLSGEGLTVDPRELTVGFDSGATGSGAGVGTEAGADAGVGTGGGAETRVGGGAGVGAGASVLLGWPGATLDLGQVYMANFDAGPGLVGTVAVLSSTAPTVKLRREP
ncbi:4'-phosphopantetheinyl transferase superfamily protein [Cryobacterium luteum]|uniref:4'-phosphopantetheinyl transferase superfamily protein n=2 Tax=Cryobacterium luteum TaxID=1424661 RepID=A0A5F0DB70_9MICO|nr:4'-phosphopantetheinyl transferase superfamily protein [Cryobacterium luteum]